MKEATGELNMTVIALVAIGAIGALFYFVLWPMIQKQLVENTCKTYGTNYHAVKGNAGAGGNEKVNSWMCCPDGATTAQAGCKTAD